MSTPEPTRKVFIGTEAEALNAYYAHLRQRMELTANHPGEVTPIADGWLLSNASGELAIVYDDGRVELKNPQ